MDAGVPIKAPVAGIAMGLVFAEGKYTTLTDILGAEDAFGDMDFKVAGTADVVTALQLDTKIAGLPADVLAQALSQAREARLKVLDVMLAAISAPRAEVGENAPKIVSFEVPVDKIGEIIGPKGKVINAIQQETGADVNIDDDGTVGTVTIGAKQRAVVDVSSSSWTRRRLRWAPSIPAGWSTSPSSGHSSTSSRAATAWSTYRGSARARGSSGWRTSSPSDRRSKYASTRSTRRGRFRSPWRASPRPATAGKHPAKAARDQETAVAGVRAVVEGRRPLRAATSRQARDAVPRSRTPSRASSSPPSAISVLPIWPPRHRPVAHGAHLKPGAAQGAPPGADRAQPGVARGAAGAELSLVGFFTRRASRL
jgi:hypothetical protein